MNIRRTLLRLRTLRWAGWIVFCGELIVVTGCVRFLLWNPEYLLPLLKATLPFLLFFFWQVRTLVAFRCAVLGKQQVLASGNHWKIGKYSEEQVRTLSQEATAGLTGKLRDPRIRIADCRGTGSWTQLSLLWPGWHRRKTIWITEGSLHYLEPEELKAVILHETAHHVREYRHDMPGGWMLGDVALFCLLFWLGSRLCLDAGGIIVVFFAARYVAIDVVVRVLGKTSQAIEHLCDLYASEKVAAGAVVNLLLKTGEEEELVEVVLARAARKLLFADNLEMEDLTLAFEDVRPYGRIFHDNLLRHASQVAGKIEEVKPDQRELKRKDFVNPELMSVLDQRKKMRRSRIKWRVFDADGDGRLSDVEIQNLCQTLRNWPERTLFRCESERNPTAYPTYSARLFLLGDHGFCVRTEHSGASDPYVRLTERA